MFYESLECLLNKKFFIKQPENTKESTKDEISPQQNNNERTSSSGSKKGSFKKVIDFMRPSSSSSVKSQSNKMSLSSDLPKERASSTNSIRIEKYESIISNINSTLPVSHREPFNNSEKSPEMKDFNNNSFFDNSQENFEFKIPKERFNNNFAISNTNEAEDCKQKKPHKINENDIFIKDVDDDYEIEDNDEENFERIIDTKLIVPGISESIFGQLNNMNNIPIAKLKHNYSLSKLKLDDDNILSVDRRQVSSSATVVSTGVIKLQTSQVTDLIRENPPKKAQLSTNLNNPSPPVSARINNYEMTKSNDQELNQTTHTLIRTTPTPPPRNKHKNHLITELNNTNNNSPKNTHYISETEHLV